MVVPQGRIAKFGCVYLQPDSLDWIPKLAILVADPHVYTGTWRPSPSEKRLICIHMVLLQGGRVWYLGRSQDAWGQRVMKQICHYTMRDGVTETHWAHNPGDMSSNLIPATMIWVEDSRLSRKNTRLSYHIHILLWVSGRIGLVILQRNKKLRTLSDPRDTSETTSPEEDNYRCLRTPLRESSSGLHSLGSKIVAYQPKTSDCHNIS